MWTQENLGKALTRIGKERQNGGNSASNSELQPEVKGADVEALKWTARNKTGMEQWLAKQKLKSLGVKID
jgi:hypothetical protein